MKEVFLVYLSEIFGSRSFSVKLPLSKEELSAKIKKEFKNRSRAAAKSSCISPENDV